MLANLIPALAGLAMLQCASAAPSYFRSDFGVPKYSKALPADLTAKEMQLWRTELDPGHSTPIAENGRIYLTASGKEALATICLDAKSGREIWKEVLRVGKI